MSQPNHLVSKAIEIQQNALENSQRAMERAMEIPVQGIVDFQRNAARLMLDGLEMGNWVNDQSVELTRNALDTYLTTVENAARDATQSAEQGLERAGDAGQQGLASTQQFATAAAGNGSRSDASGPYLPGPPRKFAAPASQPPAAPQQRPTPPQRASTPQPQPTPQQQAPGPQPSTPPQQQPSSPPQRQPSSPPQRQPMAGRHQQPATPERQPPAETRQQPPGAPQQSPTVQQQPPATPQRQPAAASRQPPAGGQPTGQQPQGQPAQPLPQFQSGVTTRPTGPLPTRPPQPQEPSAQTGPETGTETMPDGQQPPSGREVETDSDAAETPAETT